LTRLKPRFITRRHCDIEAGEAVILLVRSNLEHKTKATENLILPFHNFV
jgi:hypothetical protein